MEVIPHAFLISALSKNALVSAPGTDHPVLTGQEARWGTQSSKERRARKIPPPVRKLSSSHFSEQTGPTVLKRIVT